MSLQTMTLEEAEAEARAWRQADLLAYGQAEAAWCASHPQAGRIERLAHSFPVLHNAAGLLPFDLERFAGWATGPGPRGSTATWQAVLFILEVYAGPGWTLHRTGQRFDLLKAVNVWDASQRAALQRWLSEPWVR